MKKHSSIITNSNKKYAMSVAPRVKREGERFLARVLSLQKTFLHALGRVYQMMLLMRKRRKITFSTKDAFCYTHYYIFS